MGGTKVNVKCLAHLGSLSHYIMSLITSEQISYATFITSFNNQMTTEQCHAKTGL